MFKPKNCEQSTVLPEVSLKPTGEQSQPNEPKIIKIVEEKVKEVACENTWAPLFGLGLVGGLIYLLKGSTSEVAEKK